MKMKFIPTNTEITKNPYKASLSSDLLHGHTQNWWDPNSCRNTFTCETQTVWNRKKWKEWDLKVNMKDVTNPKHAKYDYFRSAYNHLSTVNDVVTKPTTNICNICKQFTVGRNNFLTQVVHLVRQHFLSSDRTKQKLKSCLSLCCLISLC